MPAAARVTDNSQGIPHCHSVHPWSPVPHPVIGPIMVGSTNVMIEKQPAARLNDTGVHSSAVCCGESACCAPAAEAVDVAAEHLPDRQGFLVGLHQ